MKRFLRYLAYREPYRSLRKALNSSKTSDSKSNYVVGARRWQLN